MSRRSLKPPILLGVLMIVMLVVLTVGWVLLNVTGALQSDRHSGLYWTLLSAGSVVSALLLTGTILYLVLSIKAINLTRRQSNFIDSVTHELKSPIASMKLYLQTLARHQVTPDRQAEFYRIMLDDLARLDRLTNQVLDAGRLESERPNQIEIEEVDLAAMLKRCADDVCAIYRLPKETVQTEFTPCTIAARPIDAEILFRNLIDNAVKYAGQPPKVEISFSRVGENKVIVQVADNGRGIPHAMRRKIFGRFVRLGLELEREKPGTGLGLHIARTLVRRLRGRIRVRDPKQGPGTVFEVELPAICAPVDRR
jgi:two-component system, OmpR family, phosphate regulon sensor histidine kinase PhoR